MRWFTRLRNAFSEKVENHCQALALHFVLTISVALTRQLARPGNVCWRSRNLRGFVRAVSFEKDDCVPNQAELIAPGLCIESPKTGNLSTVDLDLSTQSRPQ